MKNTYTLEEARAVMDNGLKTCDKCPEFDGVHDCVLDCWEDVAWRCARIVMAADAERVRVLKQENLRCSYLRRGTEMKTRTVKDDRLNELLCCFYVKRQCYQCPAFLTCDANTELDSASINGGKGPYPISTDKCFLELRRWLEGGEG